MIHIKDGKVIDKIKGSKVKAGESVIAPGHLKLLRDSDSEATFLSNLKVKDERKKVKS